MINSKLVFKLNRENIELKNTIKSMEERIKERDQLLKEIYSWWDIDNEGVDHTTMEFCFRIRKILKR